MRSRWIIAIVAACSSKELLVEVDTGSDVSTVELMIVDSDCTGGSANCAGIGPPDTAYKPTGNVYYLDTDDRVAAQPVDGQARFALEAGKTDFMPRLLVVGFDSNDRPNGLTFIPNVNVNQHLGEIWKITLQQRNFIQPGSNPIDVSANDMITLWRPPRDAVDPTMTQKHATCAMIQHADQSATDFVGPPGDPDCDTFTGALECDASWYHHSIPTMPALPCLAVQQDNTCMIGADASCVDGTGQPGCGLSDICVPTLACSSCSPTSLMSCIGSLGLNNVAVPRLECLVPLHNTGSNYQPCSNGSGTVIDAAATFPQGCSAPGLFNAATVPVAPVQSIMYVTATGSGAISITSNQDDPCRVGIAIDGKFLGTPIRTHLGMFVLGGPNRRIVVPIAATFTDGGACSGSGTATTCAFASDFTTEKIWACAK